MALIYTIANQKGGVGKTTTVINLGAYLADLSQRVLLVDLDPQANATSCLKIEKNSVEGGTYEVLMQIDPARNFILHNQRLDLSILPSSPSLVGSEVELVSEIARESRLRNVLLELEQDFDYILVDCPPSLGLLTLNGLVAARDGVIIPVQCEYLALEGLSQLMQTIEKVRNAINPELKIRGVLLTMFDVRTNLSADVVAEVQRYFPEKVFQTIIPRTVRLAEAPSYGLPISHYAPSSPGAESYAALARELLLKDGIQVPVSQEGI
jgi:chromosome partitioning protein